MNAAVIGAGVTRLGHRHRLAVLGALLALGVGIRLWIAFTNYGITYDVDTAYIVARLLSVHPLHAYDSIRYPYPGGFLPVILLCHWIADATGAAFWAVWKVPAIIADGGIAALLAYALERLGRPWGEQLVTVALVMLGPSFLVISGYHGQIDAAAILPALAGVIVWRLGGEQRAWQSGLLIGIGASIKTVPFFMVFALLPTIRSRREAVVMLGCAIAIPLISVAPFLIDNPGPTWKSLTFNNGVPGIAGLSMLVQPGLTHGWLVGPVPTPSSATLFLVHHQNEIVGIAVLATALLAWRRKLDCVSAAALIWLAVYLANTNWAYQYFVWGLPFFLLAGRWREVALLQLALALPTAEIYFHFGVHSVSWLYIPLLMAVWAGFAVAFVFTVSGHRIASKA
jgi:hypothetical protein